MKTQHEETNVKDVYIGIDLSGPANTADTAVCWFDNRQINLESNYDDQDILNLVQGFSSSRHVYIAIDAPLSYQMHGGYRDIDKALRTLLNQQGYSQIGVMAPTMTKMAYLTLRGIRLYSLLTQQQNITIYETHPGANLVMMGYAYEQVKNLKTSPSALTELNRLLSKDFSIDFSAKDDHQLMAFSAMLSAKRSAQEKPIYSFQSSIPMQPLFVL